MNTLFPVARVEREGSNILFTGRYIVQKSNSNKVERGEYG
jgi:hypothetical protein